MTLNEASLKCSRLLLQLWPEQLLQVHPQREAHLTGVADVGNVPATAIAAEHVVERLLTGAVTVQASLNQHSHHQQVSGFLPAAGNPMAVATHLGVAEWIEIHKAPIAWFQGKGGEQQLFELWGEPLLLAGELRPHVGACQEPAVEVIELLGCRLRAGYGPQQGSWSGGDGCCHHAAYEPQGHAARDNANTVDQHTSRSCPNHRRSPQRAIHPAPPLPLLELTLSFTPVP